MTGEEIYDKLNQIEDLDDRVLLKNILNGVFINLKAETDKKFEALEHRIFDEVKYKSEKYKIFTTIQKRNEIDLTDDFLHTMFHEDLQEPVYKIKDILKSIKLRKYFELFNIFMECSYLTFKEFIDKNLSIKGVIQTDKRSYVANFVVKENKEYCKKIEDLYKIFIDNNIPWTTVNNPYIHKIAKVVLVGTEVELDPDENIEKIDVDFGEYSKFVKYDMVPMWNIKEEVKKGLIFPTPCIDKINYEHNLSVEKGNGYLVNTHENEINYMMFKEESIIISCKLDEISTWNIIEIVSPKNKGDKQYEYDLMNNEINQNFSNKILAQNSMRIKTKSDIARFVKSYKASDYLKFKDIKLIDVQDNGLKESYDANDFIIDEIRESNIKKALLLIFEPRDKENFLNYDILSFIVSEVQLIYPEYECEGRLL